MFESIKNYLEKYKISLSPEINEEFHWYENIPPSGVLCWVSDFEKVPNNSNYITLICAFDEELKFKANHASVYWEYATPLTTEELLQFTIARENLNKLEK